MPKPSAQKTYRDCIRAIANGATVKPEWLNEVRRAAGKSESELSGDVARTRETLKATGGGGTMKKIRAIPPRMLPDE